MRPACSLSMNLPRRTQRLGADKDGLGILCPPLIFGFPVFGLWSQCAAFGPWWLPMNLQRCRPSPGARAVPARSSSARPSAPGYSERCLTLPCAATGDRSRAGSGAEIASLGDAWVLSQRERAGVGENRPARRTRLQSTRTPKSGSNEARSQGSARRWRAVFGGPPKTSSR